VLLANDVYGGTYRLLARVLQGWGLAFDVVDMTDLDALRKAVRPQTRAVWVETPTNPLLKVIDIAAAADIAHAADARCRRGQHVRDPIPAAAARAGRRRRGALVTKYLGGHSDLVEARS